MNLRPGTPADLAALDAIALESKAHWGYSSTQIQVWREALLVSAESLIKRPVCVAEKNGRAVGFVQVATDTRPWEVWAMWVLPAHMGEGVGKALLAWAKELAAVGGERELAIDADPNAKGFYQACGARLVGCIAAPIEGDPMRCRLLFRLRTSAAQSLVHAGRPR
jgi:GNAT superfamily N-acetyltransferase